MSFMRRPKSEDSYKERRRSFLNAPIPHVPRVEKSVKFDEQKSKKIKKKENKIRRTRSANDDDDFGDPDRRTAQLKEWLHNSSSNSKDAHHSLNILMLRHMSSMNNAKKIKKFYYDEYVEDLHKRVDEQRREIKRQSDELMRKIALKKLQDREGSRNVKTKKPRSEIPKDNSFLNELPKAKMYQICALEEKLMKEGKLKTVEEKDQFWEDILTPGGFKVKFGGGDSWSSLLGDTQTLQRKSSGLSDLSQQYPAEPTRTASLSSLLSLDKLDMIPSLGLIEEDPEPSQVSGEGEALSSQGENLEGKQRQSPSKSHRRKHPKVIEFEEKFKKVEFPKLSAFTLDLEPPKEDPEVKRLRDAFRQRTRLRQQEKKHLMKMYELSLTHLAATQRIVDTNKDLHSAIEGPDLPEVVSILSSLRHESLPQTKQNFMKEQILEEASDRNSENVNAATYKSEGDDIHFEPDSKLVMEKSGTSQDESSKEPVPLTVNALMDTHEVLEAKRLSSLWYNYGKHLPPVTT